MTLSDRFAGRPRAGLFARTMLYVAAFGGGTLLLSALLGFISVSLVESLSPKAVGGAARGGQLSGAQPSGAQTPGTQPHGAGEGDDTDASGDAKSKPSRARLKPGSKAGRLRANDSPSRGMESIPD